MSIRANRGKLAAMIAAAAVLAPLSLVAQAHAATTYACVKKKDGSARLFTKPTRCKKGETQLHWNSQGPAGPRGAAGTQGSQGSPGAQGSAGSPGIQGEPGPGAKIAILKTASSDAAIQTLFSEGGDSIGVSCGHVGNPSYAAFYITGDNAEGIGTDITNVSDVGQGQHSDSGFDFYAPGSSFLNIASVEFEAAKGYYAGMTVQETFIESGAGAVDFHAELIFEVTDSSSSSSECKFFALYYPVTAS
jgi:hypothetical protein